MIGFLRLAAVLLIGLSVLYLLISLYARSLARERLEKRWQSGPQRAPREAFIAAGMRRYQKSARRKALLAIYIVPPVVIIALIWVLNFQ